MLAVVPFLPALGGEILYWDDRTLLVDETRWKGFSAASISFWFGDLSHGPWQPLVWLSYAVTESLWGMNATAHHAVNLALHGIAAGLLVYALTPLIRRAAPELGDAFPPWAAALSVLLWAVHPLRVEPVAWITARRDVLSTVFVVASLLTWTRHAAADAGRPWWRSTAYHLSLALFVLAMMCKATAMGWVLVLLVLDAWPLRRGVRLLEKVPFLLVGVVVAVVALLGQGGLRAVADVTLDQRIVLAGNGAWFPLARTLVPRNLCVLYQRPHPFHATDPDLLIPALCAVAVTVALVVLRRRVPGLLAAWAIALVLVAPVSGFVPLGVQAFADRFAHLSSIPIVTAAVVGLAILVQRRLALDVAAVLAVALAAILGMESFRLARTWRTTESLFARVMDIAPDTWLAYHHMAAAAGRRQDWRTMIWYYEKGLAIKDDPQARSRLAYAYLLLGDPAAARREVLAALRLDLREPIAHETLGTIAASEGDTEAAVIALRRAVELGPGDAGRRANLGSALEAVGRPDEAVAEFEEALRLRPGFEFAIERLRALRQ